MAEMTKYEHGVPSWVDIGLPDLQAGVRFYAELFGWETQDLGEEAGHYTMASKGGKLLAALSVAQDAGPPRWTTYVNVENADAVIEKVKAAGGTVIVEPMDVMTAGRMAIFADTTGAVIAIWQAGDHAGAQLVNEAGAFSWNELSTSDLAKSKEFYSAVFGWGWGGSDEYSEGQVNGRTICGVMPRPEGMPTEIPDHWLVYFGTGDVDGDVKRAQDLGASVAVEPTDIPGTGRFSVLIDPQGALFAIFKG